MGQLTKFVPIGSCRIDSTDTPDIDTPDIVKVAFEDPNGSLVLIAYSGTATLCRSTPR